MKIERELRRKIVYYTRFPSQFKDEEAIKEEEDIPIGTAEPGTDQCDSENSSDVFKGPVTEGHFVRLQRNIYQRYDEHKELPHYVWEAMHTTFPIVYTRYTVSKVPTGEDGEIIELSTIIWKCVEPHISAHLKSEI